MWFHWGNTSPPACLLPQSTHSCLVSRKHTGEVLPWATGKPCVKWFASAVLNKNLSPKARLNTMAKQCYIYTYIVILTAPTEQFKITATAALINYAF